MGSGTVSGPGKRECGSLFEKSFGDELELKNGEKREFLEDGDSAKFEGVCKGDGYLIGFGECEGTVLPSLDQSHYF